MPVGIQGRPKGKRVTQDSPSTSAPYQNPCLISHVLYTAQAKFFPNNRNRKMCSFLIAFHSLGMAKHFKSRMCNAVNLNRDSAVLTRFAFVTWLSRNFLLKSKSVRNSFTDLYKSHFHKLSFALFIYKRKARVQKKYSKGVCLSSFCMPTL